MPHIRPFEITDKNFLQGMCKRLGLYTQAIYSCLFLNICVWFILKDLDVLYQQQSNALQDPVCFVEKLQNKVQCDFASFRFNLYLLSQ